MNFLLSSKIKFRVYGIGLYTIINSVTAINIAVKLSKNFDLLRCN